MSAYKKKSKLHRLKSDRDLKSALKMSMRSEFAPPIPEGSFEDFLSIPVRPMKKEIARQLMPETEKALQEVARERAPDIEQKLELGGLVKARRERAKLSQERIASLLGKTPDFIIRFESGDLLPWRLGPTMTANIIILFDLGFNEFTRAVKNSFAVNESRKKLRKGTPSQAAEPYYRNPSVKQAIDIISTRGAANIELPQKINDWLDSLREELEDRGAVHLLKK